MERCCHSFNNNHLVTVREWWSWLQEQNNVGSWEETGNDKSDSLLTSPSFTGLRILRTLWLLKNVTQLPPLLTTIRSHNSNGFGGLCHMNANVLLWGFAKGRQPRRGLQHTVCLYVQMYFLLSVCLSWLTCFSQQMLCEVDIIRVEGQELSAGALWVYGL